MKDLVLVVVAGTPIRRQAVMLASAAAIAGARPHAVGLQEVDDVVIDLQELRPKVDLHFLPMLRAELAARGASLRGLP